MANRHGLLSYATDEQYALEQLRAVHLEGTAFRFDRKEPPHILVAHSDEVVIVAFRGTRIDQFADILADISFLPALTSDGLVRSGFHKALLAGGVWDAAKAHIDGILGEQVIQFTGHSLGAALATIARRMYRDPQGRPLALYTFGSPRVGDELVFCGNYPPKGTAS